MTPRLLGVGDTPTEEAITSARDLIDAIAEAVPRLGVAAVVIVVGFVVARIVRWVTRRALQGAHPTSFSRVMSKLSGWVVVFLVLLAAAAIAFPSVQPVDLLAGLGFFSVAIGFAFKDIELGVSTVDIEARFWCRPTQHESLLVLDRAIKGVKAALESAGIEMPADIIALQATPSFKAALQDAGDVTPGGGLRAP